MLTTLVDGIIRSIENLAEAALACIAKLVGVWDGNMDEFGHIGENIVQGIINGIAGVWGKLTSWVSGLIATSLERPAMPPPPASRPALLLRWHQPTTAKK